jgi:alkanesulfonate monooxygenase SsuD/methylene tetrahydromethanopterin reductase-like flavin-dependent oxidoreductase (luciferase family)
LRPVVWAAREVASLQHVSGHRVVLGVGVGGDRHDRSWAAAGVPRTERGRRTDAALAVLPDLIAGRPADVQGTTVQLAPGVPVPPIVVGGLADAALRRAVAHDGWFAIPLPPDRLAPTVERLGELAADAGRPTPPITASVMVAIDGDPVLPGADELTRALSDPDGVYGIPAAAVPEMLLTGGPGAVAERIHALAGLGAERVVVTLAAGDWLRQAELLAKAVSSLA